VEPGDQRVCPYPAETVVACRYYQPVSEHGDSPGDESCRYARVVQVSERSRRRTCHRTPTAHAGRPRAGERHGAFTSIRGSP
jgi:hypothetical protein